MDKKKHKIYEEYFVAVLSSLTYYGKQIFDETKFDEKLDDIGVNFIHEVLHEETKREIVHDVLNHINMNQIFESILTMYELLARGVWHEDETISERLCDREYNSDFHLTLYPYRERLRKLG